MKLFQINDNGQLDNIKKHNFELKTKIQQLTEDNLEIIFGLEYVKSGFTISIPSMHEIPVDTLAFNRASNSFVIILYNRNKNLFDIINQGCGYLCCSLDIEYFISQCNKDGKINSLKKNDIKWGETKVIFVSHSFTIFQIRRLRYYAGPIELWEVNQFSNNTIVYSKIQIADDVVDQNKKLREYYTRIERRKFNQRKIEEDDDLFTLTKVENNLQKMNLCGKVKSITEISYRALEKSGKIIKGEKEIRVFLGNDKHILFNDKGNIIEKILYWLWDDGNTYSAKLTYKYDEKENLIEKNECKSDGTLNMKWIYKYDEKENRIEKNEYESDEILNRKYIYKYDEKGNISEEKGNISEEIRCVSDKNSYSTKWTYKYDEKGNISEESEYESDGKLNRTHKYDEKRNLIEETYYKSDGTLFVKWTHKYECDEKNNCIRQIDYENKIPQYILEREIKYYE
ncbi:MAG: hypothetical protein V1781_04395 [Bacteroidota bacterium]